MFVQARNISYTYPKGTFTLQDVSLDLSMGECTALSGPNGSGKSTLGKLLGGVLRPQRGEIFIDGKDSTKMSFGEIGRQVGYLFQNPARQLFAQTVLEELTFIKTLGRMSSHQAESEAKNALECFEMAHLADRSVVRLSGGEKQRLALCALLEAKQRLLILDEPTSGLDPCAKDNLSHMIDRLLCEGVGILLITHEPAFAARHCQRTITIADGGLVL